MKWFFALLLIHNVYIFLKQKQLLFHRIEQFQLEESIFLIAVR